VSESIADLRALATSPGGGQTILVYGAGGSAMALWAAGLAHHEDPGFAWTYLDPAASDSEILQLLVSSSSGPQVVPSPTEAAATPPPPVQGWSTLFRGRPDESGLPPRLADYLALPTLVQLLASRSTRPDGGSTILILGLDAVPVSALSDSYARGELHQILRREAVTCIVAFRGAPPTGMLDRFDLAFEIEAGADLDWSTATVRATRGDLPLTLTRPRPISEQWATLGLGRTLLARWSRPAGVPRRPV
jgi:hypothetical protein